MTERKNRNAFHARCIFLLAAGRRQPKNKRKEKPCRRRCLPTTARDDSMVGHYSPQRIDLSPVSCTSRKLVDLSCTSPLPTGWTKWLRSRYGDYWPIGRKLFWEWLLNRCMVALSQELVIETCKSKVAPSPLSVMGGGLTEGQCRGMSTTTRGFNSIR